VTGDAKKLRAAVKRRVEEIAADLGTWLDLRTDVDRGALSIALLEVAIDRYIELHGETEARELIEKSFRIVAERRKARIMN
jgi:hypothetical protein